MKKEHEQIYTISFSKRDAEIKKLEKERAAIEKELEEQVKKYVRLTGEKRLLPKKRKVNPLLLDGADVEKV